MTVDGAASDTSPKPMVVLVTGSTTFIDSPLITASLDAVLLRARSTGSSVSTDPVLIITGMASGVDAIARSWADRRCVALFAESLGPGSYPTPMHDYNEELLAMKPDVVLAFKTDFDPTSRQRRHEPGTEHMVRLACEAGVPVILNGTPFGSPASTGS